MGGSSYETGTLTKNPDDFWKIIMIKFQFDKVRLESWKTQSGNWGPKVSLWFAGLYFCKNLGFGIKVIFDSESSSLLL